MATSAVHMRHSTQPTRVCDASKMALPRLALAVGDSGRTCKPCSNPLTSCRASTRRCFVTLRYNTAHSLQPYQGAKQRQCPCVCMTQTSIQNKSRQPWPLQWRDSTRKRATCGQTLPQRVSVVCMLAESTTLDTCRYWSASVLSSNCRYQRCGCALCCSL